MSAEIIVHPFEPVYNNESEILILGSFPSVKSRDNRFYYGHERNRFWRVISALFDDALPETVEQKKTMLLKNKIALWDVAASCSVHASSDSSIRNVVPNDIRSLVAKTNITRIFANGKTSEQLYNKLVLPQVGVPITVLPSTSPANAAFTLEKLIDSWQALKEN